MRERHTLAIVGICATHSLLLPWFAQLQSHVCGRSARTLYTRLNRLHHSIACTIHSISFAELVRTHDCDALCGARDCMKRSQQFRSRSTWTQTPQKRWTCSKSEERQGFAQEGRLSSLIRRTRSGMFSWSGTRSVVSENENTCARRQDERQADE